MDSRAAFAFALIAVALGGLFALATGRLSYANGQITIGAAPPPTTASTTTPAASSTTSAGAGVPDPSSGSFGTYNSAPVPTAPTIAATSPVSANQAAIASILGGSSSSTTTLAQIYDPSQTLALVGEIANGGTTVYPYGTGVAA